MQNVIECVIVYLHRKMHTTNVKGGKDILSEAIFGQLYEDKRTHRAGKIVEYDDKYKTYLLETPEGKSFNITSSQFRQNWIPIEQPQEVVKQEVEITKTGKKRYSGPTQEQKDEVNDMLATFMLVGAKYADSYQNDLITVKPDIQKRKFLLKIRHHTVFIVDCLFRNKTCRVWLKEYASDLMSWTVKPLSMKRYPTYTHNTAIEFPVENLQEVLDDLRAIVIQEMTEMEEK